ncbi:MAG TPA: ATP-binding protein [Dissulfurispiraceae bacterium]|nr:ATP-binding protein [Dissulfurispiraceae bacterium]
MKTHFLIIGVLVLIVSILISLNIFFQQSLQIEIAEEFNKQQLLIADSVANNISDYIGLLTERAAAIAARLSVEQALDIKAAEHEARRIRSGSAGMKIGVSLLSPSGDLLLSSDVGQSLGDALPAIKKAIPSLPAASTFLIEADPCIHIIAPIYHQGTLIGTAVLSGDMQDIAAHFITELRQHGKGAIYLLNAAGTLVYHPTEQGMVGKNLHKTDANCSTCHLSFDLWRNIIAGKLGPKGRYVAPSGEDRMIAFSRPTNARSWIIFVSAPVSELTATTRKSMTLYSYLIIAILLTTITVSTALIYFNRKRVQAEELEKRRKQVEQYAHELEEKVQQRTAELTSEKEKLNTIVSAIGSGIMMLDKQGVVQWTNQIILEMAGVDVVGRSCEELCAECQVSGAYAENNIDTVIMLDLFGKKGRQFQVTTAPIRDEEGKIRGYIRLIHDVTEIKRMEDQMSNSEKLVSIGRLAAGIAHEIGNPLTSIFSFVQILQEIEQDEFKKDSLKTICFHVNRISETLKQLSGFSKMPMGEAKECRVNDIIETSVNLIQYDKRAKDIQIVRELAESLPCILADGNQLSQVCVNLVLNAIDAMPDGGTLTISSEATEAGVLIRFSDTGVGIPPENLSKIFDPFYTTKEKGTGLGLSVSYTIIKKLNGLLSVESDGKSGTTFTIWLPSVPEKGTA